MARAHSSARAVTDWISTHIERSDFHVIEEFSTWLAGTPLSVTFQATSWFVPLVQTLHIVAIAILLTAIYAIGFRLIRSTSPSLALPSTRSSRWIWSAFALLFVTGVLLTIAEPARELLSWVFRLKMVLVLLLMALYSVVQYPTSADAMYWVQSRARRYAARAIGVAFLLLGAGIVTAGRWIAYA